jgi:hypothetical protein
VGVGERLLWSMGWFQGWSLSLRRRDLAHVILRLRAPWCAPASPFSLTVRRQYAEKGHGMWSGSLTSAAVLTFAWVCWWGNVICPRYSPWVLLAAGAVGTLTGTPVAMDTQVITMELELSSQLSSQAFPLVLHVCPRSHAFYARSERSCTLSRAGRLVPEPPWCRYQLPDVRIGSKPQQAGHVFIGARMALSRSSPIARSLHADSTNAAL